VERVNLRRAARLLLAPLVTLSMVGLAADPTVVTIITSRSSPPHFPVAMALAGALGKTSPPLKANVQSSRDPVENLEALDAGRADIAFTLGDTLSSAQRGNENAGFGAPLSHLRAIAALYPSYIQIIARADSGVRTLRDLRGKRVSVGIPRSSIEQDARTILAAAGIEYRDFRRVEYLPFGESVELIKERRLDATLQSAALGVSTLRDLALAIDLVFVPVPESVARRIDDPAYARAVIPANTYRGQPNAVTTLAVQNVVVTHEAVGEVTVYSVTKALWTDAPAIASAHPAAKDMDRNGALAGIVVPLHPGAERYYRETGILR
jgi:TRAP transporter TAXI family solute receptor